MTIGYPEIVRIRNVRASRADYLSIPGLGSYLGDGEMERMRKSMGIEMTVWEIMNLCSNWLRTGHSFAKEMLQKTANSGRFHHSQRAHSGGNGFSVAQKRGDQSMLKQNQSVSPC